MRQVNPAWKLVLAILSLVFTVLIWGQGLKESFDRPSVTPKLSLRQNEIALLAEPSIPISIRPALVGENPAIVLKNHLAEIPRDELSDRERIVLAALQTPGEERSDLLRSPLDEDSLEPIREVLLDGSIERDHQNAILKELGEFKKDPLLYQTTCRAIQEGEESCYDKNLSRSMAIRLSFTYALPIFGSLLGVVFLIRHIFLVLRNSVAPWPSVKSIPLSLVDMVLLVAGGFVVLGEVLFPTFAAPLVQMLTSQVSSPVSQSLKVLIGYTVMTIPSLFILRRQLKSLGVEDQPVEGWLQWRFKPINSALIGAARGWLMVMPLVLLSGWLMNSLVGDQGGSNPLLELVLRSQDPLALGLLLITTVVFAPFFEEVIFRGALLPVLAQRLGRTGGVFVSAIAFAMAHLSVGELSPLIVLGIGLGMLRLSSGRLFPCILMHALWNGLTFVNLILLGG